MANIVKLSHRVALLVARRQPSVNLCINFQTLFRPKNILDTNLHPLQLNCLPSNLIIKSFKSTESKKGRLDEKPTRRRFSPEEDQKLLDHINVHGSHRNSLKHIAVVLDRTCNSVRSRCQKLQCSNECETQSGPKEWDYADEKKLVDYIFKLKKIKTNNLQSLIDIKSTEFKGIAPDLERSAMYLYNHWKKLIAPCLELQMEDLATSKTLKKDVLKIVERKHEKTIALKGYSDEDKKFIIKQVELKGDVHKTWIFIGNKLGKTAKAVRYFYLHNILRSPTVVGPFSSEEDEIILRHVEVNGRTMNTFDDLAKELGRSSPESISVRHKKLMSKNEFETNAKPKEWALEEDKSLISHIFNIKEIKANNVLSLENVKLVEFTAVATELKRSSSSCYSRWMTHIVPLLKTHLKKLPLTHEWKKQLLSYIVQNEIKHKKEMDIDQILRQITPGQTSISLIRFLDSLKKESVDGVMKPSKLPLCDLASKRIQEQRPDDPSFNENHKGEQKRLEWCQDVISHYKTLI